MIRTGDAMFMDLLQAMTRKEITVRYGTALLGFLWIILNPLFQMLIIGFIFQNFVFVGSNNYYLFLFTGLLPWNFFSLSLTKSANSVVNERKLIQKANFAREVIPLSIVLANFMQFSLSIIVLIVFLTLTGNLSLFTSPVQVFLFFFSLSWLLALTGGVSLLVSALTVRYRDVNFLVQALAILWFYATPIIYPGSLLPLEHRSLLLLNPLAYPVETFRASLLGTHGPHHSLLFFSLVISLILISFGFLVFKKESPTFSDWL